MPCISIPHKQLIGLGFFIHELCLLVQNFIFLCHFTITTFHFSSGKKNQKHDINTFVKGAHFTSNVVCRQESPAAGLTSLCLRSAHICMSYYNAAARGLLGGAVQTDRKGRHRGKTRRPMLPAAPCSRQPHAPSSPMLPAAPCSQQPCCEPAEARLKATASRRRLCPLIGSSPAQGWGPSPPPERACRGQRPSAERAGFWGDAGRGPLTGRPPLPG